MFFPKRSQCRRMGLMMRIPFGVKLILCGVLMCLPMLAAMAQPPALLTVNSDCQVVVPDYIENYETIFVGFTPPWNQEATLEQFPPAGAFAPGALLEEEWPETIPEPFPDWPTDTMPVYVIETFNEIVTPYKVANIEDRTAPGIRSGAPNLFQRIEVSGVVGSVVIPDFRTRLRPFIFDNCTPADLLVMTQNPPPGPVPAPATLPSGRTVSITIRDERGNTRSVDARVEVVDITNPRPRITPREVNEGDRRFEGGVCSSWDCGLLAYWDVYWECGVPFDDPGATAINPITGADLTHLVQSRVVGVANTTITGFRVFTIRYWIGDESNLAANGLVERRVSVGDYSDPVITLGAIGGGPSGAHPIWRNWPATLAPDWVEPAWVRELRESNIPFPWIIDLPRLFDFVPAEWNDETAMPWRCWYFEPYKEYLDVYDDCEGLFDEAKLDENVLVVIVKVQMASDTYADGEETFYAGGYLGELRNANLDLPYGRPGVVPVNPWYGYRIYYFAWDDSGNLGYISRHVNPVAGEGISLAQPTTITIRCDGDGIQQLYDVERLDVAGSACRGNITHLIRATGGIDTVDGYYVPGTYYRYYTIEGGQNWPLPWRRTIIVEDTDPEVQMYDKLGNPVSGAASAVVVPWCEFLDAPGATPLEQSFNWANNWWAAQPYYGVEEPGQYGYGASHICESDLTMTAWVDVRGVGVLRNTMMNYYTSALAYSPPTHLLGVYGVDYELSYPTHNLVRAVRPVMLIENVQLDLIFDAQFTGVTEEGDRTVARVECGSGVSLTAPEISRVWDGCTGKAIERRITMQAFRVLDEGPPPVLTPIAGPAAINTSQPGVYQLRYFAVVVEGPSPTLALVRIVEIRVEDTTPPAITLLGDPVVYLDCSDPTYVDPGATAFDLCDGNLTGSIFVSGHVGPFTNAGEYTRTYTVRDSSGNEASVTRTIIVLGLVMELNGVTRTETDPVHGLVHVTEWECNLPYTPLGVSSATDLCSGANLISKVTDDDEERDEPLLGDEYLVTYTLTHNGQTITVLRLIRVMNSAPPIVALEGSGETPLTPLPQGRPQPRWWTDALREYELKYPGGSELPLLWPYQEVWDTSLSAPLKWKCDLPKYEDPGASAEDICDGPGLIDTDDIVLILTQFNVQQGREYFRFVGKFGDFDADPPGHAYDMENPTPGTLNLREDKDGFMWRGYRAYYLAWDSANNLAVASRLITPDYGVSVSVAPQQISIECGATTWPATTVKAVDLCSNAPLTPKRWIWRRNDTTVINLNASGKPINYEESQVFSQVGEYVVVYAATNSEGYSDPELDADGMPLNPVDLVIAGGNFMQELTVRDTAAPVITLKGKAEMDHLFGTPFVEPGYTAIDACDGDLTRRVQISEAVNPQRLGDQTLVYSVVDSHNNQAEATRLVHVIDPSLPEITLLGPSEVEVECLDVYNDAGAEARDRYDNTSLTDRIQVTGLTSALSGPGGARPGQYVITYRVSRVPGGKEATATRVVTVADTTPPVIVLRGNAALTVDCGAAYRDMGVQSALDACDGDITRRVTQIGNVDTNTPGNHVITFSVTDQAGNEGSVTRQITVRDNCTGSEEGEIEGEGEGEGEPQIPVPNVVSLTLEDANAIIANANLTVGVVTHAYDVQMPRGSVISQAPAAEQLVDPLTPIDLVVSAGPSSCGCAGGDPINWGNVFLGALALLVLFIVSLFFGVTGDMFK